MGGKIEWGAILYVSELLGVEDVDLLVHGLIEIREHYRRQERAEAEARKRRR